MELENHLFTIRSNHYKDCFLCVDKNMNAVSRHATFGQASQFKLQFHENGYVSIYSDKHLLKDNYAYLSMSGINNPKFLPEGFGRAEFKYSDKRDLLACERFLLICMGGHRYALQSSYQSEVYLRLPGERKGICKEGLAVNFQHCSGLIMDCEQLIIEKCS